MVAVYGLGLDNISCTGPNLWPDDVAQVTSIYDPPPPPNPSPPCVVIVLWYLMHGDIAHNLIGTLSGYLSTWSADKKVGFGTEPFGSSLCDQKC